jgi:phosphatidylethanolamine/phosphatidyl-N-methylethanolamine N-methyltransferase
LVYCPEFIKPLAVFDKFRLFKGLMRQHPRPLVLYRLIIAHIAIILGAFMTKDYALSAMSKAYAHWAPIYDTVYAKMLRPARREAVAAAQSNGARILEVGCGTGLSLRDYGPGFQVTGVDLSEPMLRQAQAKIDQFTLHDSCALAVMDACRLGFADDGFDAVVGQFMITLVPDAEAALDEFARVLRPGGEIILANHIGAQSGLLAAIENGVAPLAQKLGWRSNFPLQRISDWARSRGFNVASVKRVAPVGFFTLIRLQDSKASA